MLFLEFQKTNYLDKEAEVMERKYIRKVLFAPALMLLLPSMVAEAKTKLEAKNKTVTVGQT